MDKQTAENILARYRAGNCTEAEQQLVESWILHGVTSPLDLNDAQLLEDLLDIRLRLERNLHAQHPTKTYRLRKWLPYVAAALIALAVGALVIGDQWSITGDQWSAINDADIAPGGNRATLTLADGRTIDLSEAQGSIIIGDRITYADGSLVLSSGSGEQPPKTNHDESRLLTLTTPQGGTYQITLPDGTKVWLNAASTLKYPSRFDRKERIVELEGEAYFDVSEQWSAADSRSANKKIPFLVKTKEQTVEVLGTQFNIMAYADEVETKTTLVEGKVKVSDFTLKPGQQATLRGTAIDIQVADIQSVVAWKEGYFVFNGTELRDAMRQLSRWYKVEVIYEGNIPRTPFFGKISRDDTLVEVLDILKAGKVNFRIEQREKINRVVVMP
ncbi:FecR family protein [Parapedobacter koreensis]|uniref:FecR family protein n=1 Tax=Parapedobacter koreensis TaxID=332977 RepID=A0A1H7SNA1_9SPHI|nr:FecR family protein [Parapedobacter koreensis]SEL73948.1 FecR family protein [Parapedobacter koreensis]